MSKKRPIQVYLRGDQVEALHSLAERRGESVAALIRQGVDLFLDQLPAEEDPLRELLGIYDSGRGDLAENHDEILSNLVVKESHRES